MNCGHGLDIDREDWKNGYGLSRFDLTPAGSSHPNHLIPHRAGNVNLYLKYWNSDSKSAQFNRVRGIPKSFGD